MDRRFQEKVDYLKTLVQVRSRWDFYESNSNGVFSGRVNVHTKGKKESFTLETLNARILEVVEELQDGTQI